MDDDMSGPRIWVPKLKIQEAEIRGATCRVEGRFILEACNRYGQAKRRLEWEQLITNWGMERIAQGQDWLNPNNAHYALAVGVGTAPFDSASMQLTSQIGGRTTASVSASNEYSSDPLEGYRQTMAVTRQFALGAVVANLTEVGFFSSTSGNTGCFLDLIRDNAGNPTTFPVTAEDQLRVTHVLHMYPFLGTIDGSFTIGGSAGSGTHDYECSMGTLALSDADTISGHIRGGGAYYPNALGLGDVAEPLPGVGIGTQYLTGTGGTSGPVYDNDGQIWTISNSHTLGLTNANWPAGINGVRLYSGSGGSPTGRAYKFFIDPPIPKFAGSIQRILTLHYSASVSRREENVSPG